jgi:transcriptional regulator with XRE-family HTH domain
MKFADIGQQLRAYRLESGLRAEEIAARLGVSRAALYRYEKGEVIKLDTVRRLAELLKISPLSLLGIGVEYFARPVAFLERLRQIEEQAEQIILFGGALCYQTSTEAFDAAVAEAWTEASDASADRFAARATAEQCLGLLGMRRRAQQQRRANILAILSEAAIQRFLADGVAGGLAVPDRIRARCRAIALSEVESMAGLMESVPIGVQVGLLAGPDPSGSFMVLRGRDRANVIGTPFAPDAAPFAAAGVASIIGADDAIAVHQRVAETAWRDALKGADAAARLRTLMAETKRAE